MNNKLKPLAVYLLAASMACSLVSCEKELDDLTLQPGQEELATDEDALDDSDIVGDEPVDPIDPNDAGGGGGTVSATFAAVILNGDFETYSFKDSDNGSGVVVDNDQDNADAFNFTPSGTVIEDSGAEVASPYTWSNGDLKSAILAAGCDDTSTTGGVTSSAHEGNWGIKLAEVNRRLYQEFAVEVGVTYTINMYVRKESTNALNVYILNNAIADETDLAGNSDVVYPVLDGDNVYNLHTFEFTATSTTAIFYAVPSFDGAADKGNCEYTAQEILLDNISIDTPGFSSGGGGGTDPDPDPDPATFAAVILNGDFETYSFKDSDNGSGVVVDNDQDNADAFNFTPPSTVIEDSGTEVASPYTWSNGDLKSAILAAGCDDTSTTGGVTSSAHEGNWGIKLAETNRRLYQQFDVEVGITYTISMYVRKESTNALNIYILNNAIADETDLAGNSDVVYPVLDGDNVYNLHTFEFTATSTTAIFYAVPSFDGAADKGNCEYTAQEILLDNISIATPGF